MKLSQQQQLQSRAQKLYTRIESLVQINLGLLSQRQIDAINETIQEYRLELSKVETAINTKHTYLFNFEGGGWNSVSAVTEEEAMEIALKEYHSPTCQVDFKSFRLSTPGDYNNLLSLFY